MDRQTLAVLTVAGALVAGLTALNLSDAPHAAATADTFQVTAYTVRPGSVQPLFPLEDGGFAVVMEACAMLWLDGGGESLGCTLQPVTAAGDLAAAEVLNRLAASSFATDAGAP